MLIDNFSLIYIFNKKQTSLFLPSIRLFSPAGSGPLTLEKNMESLWLVKCSTSLNSYLFTLAPSALCNQEMWAGKSVTADGPEAKTMSQKWLKAKLWCLMLLHYKQSSTSTICDMLLCYISSFLALYSTSYTGYCC